jgi:Type VI secretion system/phage-baseplate injector OB domain
MGLVNVGRDIMHRPSLKVQNYTGVVVDDNDPKKRQRVRIRIPQLHRNVPDDKLPWSMPQAEGQMNAGGGVGTVKVPPKGSHLFLKYDDDEPHHVYYGGSPTTDNVHKDNEILKEDYPDTMGHVDQAGNKATVNTRKNTITTTHVSGSQTHIDGAGNVTVFGAGKVTVAASGDLVLAAGGNISIHAGGNVDVKGGQIQLNGAGAGTSIGPAGARTRPTIESPSGKTSL